MASLFIHGCETFGERHVDLCSSGRVRLLYDLVEHVFQRLITSLNSANLLRRFQCCGIEPHSLLGERIHEHTSVVHASIPCNKLRPTKRSDPALCECL